MRTTFGSWKNRYYAKKDCPWACRIIKVDGGYVCFESEENYMIWKNQK